MSDNEIIYEIAKDRKDDNSFAVTLVLVPEFPFDEENIDEVVHKPLCAVVAAVYDDKGWSFSALSSKEKHIIGDRLLEYGCKYNEWWWCNMYEVQKSNRRKQQKDSGRICLLHFLQYKLGGSNIIKMSP